MKFVEEVFRAIIAHNLCHGNDCESCKEYFNVEECPSEIVEVDDQQDLAKILWEKVQEHKNYDLGPLGELNEDDIVSIIEEITK